MGDIRQYKSNYTSKYLELSNRSVMTLSFEYCHFGTLQKKKNRSQMKPANLCLLVVLPTLFSGFEPRAQEEATNNSTATAKKLTRKKNKSFIGRHGSPATQSATEW
jgi:hypothetical protein